MALWKITRELSWILEALQETYDIEVIGIFDLDINGFDLQCKKTSKLSTPAVFAAIRLGNMGKFGMRITKFESTVYYSIRFDKSGD